MRPGEPDLALAALAARVLALRRDVSRDGALSRSRLHALATKKTIADTARDVIVRTVRLA